MPLGYCELMNKEATQDSKPEVVDVEVLDSSPDVPLIGPAENESEVPAHFDPLKRYLYEIGKYELLTREDEEALAVKYKETGDEEAAYMLITANLRLVVKIAMEFQNYWMKNLLDLIQEGNVGLMQALNKFDPYRGVKFSYYASFWIKAYILKSIMDNWHLVRLGTTQAQRKLFYNLKKEKERIMAEGLEPGPKLLAERLHVSEKDVVEMDQRLGGREVSLDAPLKEDADEPHMNFLASSEEAVDNVLADNQIRDLLHDRLMKFRGTLNERDLKILDRRILAEEPETLQEMGQEFGISRERVRQLEERIKKDIRRYLLDEIPELGAEDYLSLLGMEE